jgi:hypothetical protein
MFPRKKEIQKSTACGMGLYWIPLSRGNDTERPPARGYSAAESGVATSSSGRRSALTANNAATTAAPSIKAAAKT